MDKKIIGHMMAFFVSLVWGVTFVSTKVLLEYYPPIDIMILRFFLAYIILILLYPQFHKPTSLKDEFNYFLSGVTGVTLYFVFENTALKLSTASNVGLILAAVPLVVAIMTSIFSDEHLHRNMILGFLIAISGVSLVLFNGRVILHLNPIGDLYALICCFFWGVYSLTIKNMDINKSNIYNTRKIFSYGLITSLLYRIFQGPFSASSLLNKDVYLNLIFLAIFASALCFIFYNEAIKRIGSITTSNYLYLMPLFTIIASSFFLKERINILMIIGCILIIIGTYVSDRGFKLKKADKNEK